MTGVYVASAACVWGLVWLRGVSMTAALLRVSLWARTCAIYGGAVVAAVLRDHARLWAWAAAKAKEEVR
jgi:hypothetical protein